MDRRKFLRSGVSSTFVVGAVAGAAAGAAGTIALAPKFLRPAPLPGKVSHAQQGEDLVLWQITHGVLGLEHPTYMDIGAHHPVINNNTYLFYERGSRGVLVEPNPALYDVLAAVRPEDTLLRAGIGPSKQSQADYYVIAGAEADDGQLNTFSHDEAMQLVTRSNGRYRIETVIKIPLLNINDVMREKWNAAPNVLSIDTEGFDLPILRSLDFKRFRPDVIVAETVELGGRQPEVEILEFMVQQGYQVRGGSFINTVFVDRRHIT
jgi:FkbM family methyltransferase